MRLAPPFAISSVSDDPSRSGHLLADRRAAYAEDCFRDGNAVAAADLMRQALELAPDWTLGRTRLAVFQEASGERDEAIATLKDASEADEDGRFGTPLALARLGAAPVPNTAPPAYVEALFDSYAERFERSLVEKLGYRGPDILAEDLAAVRAPLAFEAALDLGCGTGLMGERLRPFVGRLDGVDLSTSMLAKAAAKRVYDSLTAGDILDARLEWAGAYDLATAADVLIYVGDLRPLFDSVARRLRTGGLFAFTVETHEGKEPFMLQPSLRFAHAPEPLRETLAASGFAVARERPIVIRKDRGQSLPGLSVIAALRS